MGRPATIQSIPLKVGEFVLFHQSGKLKRAALADPVTIAGTTYPAGTTREWDEAGKIIRF